MPLPGPQTLAFNCKADILYYGGAAGGGKTDLLLGLALRKHSRSIIFRREYPQLQAIIDRSEEVFASLGVYNGQNKRWRFAPPYSHVLIEFGAVQYEHSVKKYQGRPHDLKAFDEIPHFSLAQFTYLSGWNRVTGSTKPGQRTQIVGAGNPPLDAEERWVIEFWEPWLDDHFSYPAEPGELRWCIAANGKTYWVDGPGEYTFKGQDYISKSRTFIPSGLDDNLYLEDTEYRATLHSLPEPLRSQLLFGDFKAGLKDDPKQVIPTAWLRLAQQRWRQGSRPTHIPLSQVGVDVARGGNDKTVLTKRTGHWFDSPDVYPGITTSDGIKVSELIVATVGGRKCRVGIDAIGVGSSPIDFLSSQNFSVVPLNAAEGTEETDRSGRLGFLNKRACWYWKLREALDPENGEDLAIPDDSELSAELLSMKWKLTSRGIQVEPKDAIKDRLGRSPDKADSLIYAHANDPVAGQGLLDMMEQEYEQLQQRLEEERRQKEKGNGQ